MIGRQTEQDDLTRRAARSLAAGDAVDAFRLAQRLCRHYSRPDARHLLLRAQALIALQNVYAARSDFNSALDIDPTDNVIAGMVLQMAHENETALRRRAACIIVASPRSSFATLALAFGVLLAPSTPVIAQAHLIEGRLEGWVAWLGADRISAGLRCIDGSDVEFTLEPQADHPLAAVTWKASSISRSLSAGALPHLAWKLADESTSTKAITTIVAEAPIKVLDRSLDRKTRAATECFGCSVVLPIYGDPLATARCLDSLAVQSLDHPLTIVMVNDRPDDESMNFLTRRAEGRFGFQLIVNPANLGFVEAVKRGIAMTDPRHDIALLNADTILPEGALRRLSSVAYSRLEIGTVTPFSNNGELTSIPKPFLANPLGDLGRVREIDAAAQRANAQGTVTISNGIGFCLYVKRACLDAVGGFPDIYHRGYFEDVELCLRARAVGFTNVCATGVYVGHAGSRSFKDEKKVLVARNAKILKSRFPWFLEEGLAFVKADPLYEARQAIAWELQPSLPQSRLVLSASPRSFALHHWVRRLRRSGKTVLTLTRTSPLRPFIFSLNSIDFDLHHDSKVDLATETERFRLLTRLQAIGVTCVDILDELDLEPAFAAGLEARFQVRSVLSRAPSPSVSGQRRSLKRDDDASTERADPGQSRSLSMRPARRRLVALNAMVSAVLHERDIPHSMQRPARLRRTRDIAASDALGIVHPDPSSASERLMRTLLAKIADLPVVIIGQTLSDAAFMAHPRVFVTGRVDHLEYEKLVVSCRVGLLISLDRQDGFGLVSSLSASTGRPGAYFDWSHGSMISKDGDLGLDPTIDDDEAGDKLLAWAGAYLRGDVADA